MPPRLVEDGLIGVGDRGPELTVIRGPQNVLLARQDRENRARDRPDRSPARNIPAAVSSHAIGHHQEHPGPRFGQIRRLDFHREQAVFIDPSDFPDVRGESEPSPGGANDRLGPSRRHLLFRDLANHDHVPPRRVPPLKVIVMYGTFPAFYSRERTSPSARSCFLIPGICRYVLPPSWDMAVPFMLPRSSIQQRPFGSFTIRA